MAPLFQQPFMSGGFPSMNRAGGAVGGWVELARTTLGGAGDNIDVSSLADKRYYMYLIDALYTPGAVINGKMRFNSDSGSNYARRNSYSGGADTTLTSQTSASVQTSTGNPYFGMGYVANYATKEKMALYFSIDRSTATAAYAPERDESVYKWANTSNAISSFNWFNDSTGDFDPGAEMVVLGYDPADTHTNNFWEELDSVTLSSSNTRILSNVFTPKKYMWIQVFGKAVNDAANWRFRVGYNTIDTGSNYSTRNSQDGASDTATTSESKCDFGSSGILQNTGAFANMFVINNASNEKLFITHSIKQQGSGAGTASSRTEGVHKWANTSNQFNIIEIETNNGTSQYASGSTMKIWGAD